MKNHKNANRKQMGLTTMKLVVLHLRRIGRMRLTATALTVFVSCVLVFAPFETASAQVITNTVNNEPITNIDIEQRIKLLKVLRKPATADAALDSLIDDHVKSGEYKKYNVKPTDADISHEIVRVAGEMKIDPNALAEDLEHAGVHADHYKSYFGTQFAFSLLVQALNKGIEASETEVRAELAKEGGKAAAGAEYTVRQIILPLPANAPQATIEARVHLAEQIRTRFTDCDQGAAMIQGMDDAVIKPPVSRTAIQLGEGLKGVLDKTGPGHVTPPQRSTVGIEMLALCNRGAVKDDTAARDAITQKILAVRYASEEARLLKELRSHAVVQKR